jgi:hypothetical protein
MVRRLVVIGFVMCFAVLLFSVAACTAAGDEPRGRDRKSGDSRVGGPCAYTSYDGIAHITRIVKTETSRNQAGLSGGPGYEGFEIWFRFVPAEGIAIEGWPAQAVDQERLLTLQNGWYPGPRFLEKYKLAEGSDYPCTLKVIQKGTCTPILFDFPTIDTADYFEIQR